MMIKVNYFIHIIVELKYKYINYVNKQLHNKGLY